jgi:rhodanese-related sulfurtransferase
MDMLRLQSSSGADYFHQKLTHEIGPRALHRLLNSNEELQLVDVRQPGQFDAEHIGQAVNLPFEGEQSQYIYHLSKHVPVVVYSYDEDCTLALEAAYLLSRNGYAVRTLIGGFAGWKHYNLPVASQGESASGLRAYQAVDDFLPPLQA